MVKNCFKCQKPTTNPKFCSKSCANSFANKKPKRTKKKFFCHCGKETQNRRKFCKECHPNYRDWNQVSLFDVISKRKYQSHSRIRDNARKTFFKHMAGKQLKCFNCGYSKHIEVCHIKPIYSFDLNTKIAEINSITNLVGLCPNCHWEFDNNLLTLDFSFLAEFTK